VKPAAFTYEAPTSVAEAVAALAEDGAVVLAGGQSLVLELVYRDQRPRVVVDVNRVAGLVYQREDDAGLVLGALVRHAELERGGADPVRRLLALVAPYVAHPPIRSRGTFCGSLAWGHPAAEWNAVALAFDAEVLLSSAGGSRTVAAQDWYLGRQATVRRPDELVTAVRLVGVPPGTGTGFAEHRRTHASFADVAVVCAVTAAGGTVTGVRLAVAGLGDRPLRLTGPEQAVLGAGVEEAAAEVRRQAGRADLPGDDHQRAVAAVLAGRTVAQALVAAGAEVAR
jgi:carbon-monoxide dehydrogenase medium subunit